MNLEIEQFLKKYPTPSGFIAALWELSTNQNRIGRRYAYDPNNKNLFRVYRSTCFASPSELPLYVSRLSYNPLPKERGRCNQPNQSVFYSSAGLPTTFVEMKDNIVVGSIVVVSEWHAVNNIMLQIIDGSSTSFYEKLMKSIFTEISDKYYLYSAEIFNHLTGADFIDGLIYPSIPAQNNSENIAFKKESIDLGKLAFWNAKAYKIKNIQDRQWDVDEIDFSLVDKNGILIWSGQKGRPVLKSKGEEIKAISNGWSYDFYDSNNNLLQLE